MFAAEIQIIHFLQSLFPQKFVLNFFLPLSNILLLISLLSFLYFYVCVDREIGCSFFVSLVLNFVIVDFLKISFAEKRPFVADSRIKNYDVLLNNGYSFPSAHCAIFSSFLSSLYSNFRFLFSFRNIFFVISLLLLVLCRMVLGSHYLHDCFSGILIGYFVSFICVFLYKVYEMRVPFNLYVASSLILFIGISANIVCYGNLHLLKDYLNITYAFSSAGSFMLGNTLEKNHFNISREGRVLKKLLRFIFLIVLLLSFSRLYFNIMPNNAVFTNLFFILFFFFISFVYTVLAHKFNLFEKKVR